MKYNGKIKNINHIVISDPVYTKTASQRYEKENLNLKNWVVELELESVSKKYEDYIEDEIVFNLLLTKDENACELDENGIRVKRGAEIKDYSISVDTDCIALGINENADEIIKCNEIWQPKCALKTLTNDFGSVVEGKYNNKLSFLFVKGSFSKDTGYEEDDILYYLVDKFKIVDLSKKIINENYKNEDMLI